jgi:tight adherence protein C
MALAISAFMAVAALVYMVGLLFIRGGKNRETDVLAGGRTRSLVFGPSTAALAGTIPSTGASKEAVTKLLAQAGYYHRFAFHEFASLRNALTIGWVLFIGTLLVAFTEPGDAATMKLLAVGVGGAMLFYGMPRLILHSRAKARLGRIHYALPDALDMVTMCVAGGVPLNHSLSRVGEEITSSHPDLACELRILSRQSEAGSMDKALKLFAKRLDTPEAHSLAGIVGQTDKQGSSVASAFHEFADGVRRERRQRAEEHGNKTSIKMLFPLVFCLAPPVYIMLLAPAVIEMRSFVMEENRPGGILAPTDELLSSAAADPELAAAGPNRRPRSALNPAGRN